MSYRHPLPEKFYIEIPEIMERVTMGKKAWREMQNITNPKLCEKFEISGLGVLRGILSGYALSKPGSESGDLTYEDAELLRSLQEERHRLKRIHKKNSIPAIAKEYGVSRQAIADRYAAWEKGELQ